MMRTANPSLLRALLLLLGVDAAALIVGINPNIHNGTGQDAYDFHLEGVLESSARPIQVDQFVFPIDPIPNFDWTYKGGAFTDLGNDLWGYSGTWSGNVPVHNCQTIHIGKYFDVVCHNVFEQLRGWWTDQNGDKINQNAGNPGGSGIWVSDVPLIGFNVQDQQWPQTIRFQNATTEAIQVRNVQVAVSPTLVPLANLMQNDPLLLAQTWATLVGPGGTTMAPGATQTFDLGAVQMNVPPGWYVIDQGEMYDPTLGEYVWWGSMHGSHFPEPGTLCLLALGTLGVAVRRRR